MEVEMMVAWAAHAEVEMMVAGVRVMAVVVMAMAAAAMAAGTRARAAAARAAAAEMVVLVMVVERALEVRERAAVGGAGMARASCMEVRLMAARSLAEGWAVTRPMRMEL
jgi:hypothetical protein